MRLGQFTFRATVPSFTFLPASSKVTPTCSNVLVARNTFIHPSYKVAPTSSIVASSTSKKIVTFFIVTPPCFVNLEICFTFLLCFFRTVQ